MKDGRPLRFLTVTLAGWTAVRIFALWPSAEPLREAARHLGIAPASAAAVTVAVPQPVLFRPATLPVGDDGRQASAIGGSPQPGPRTVAATAQRASPIREEVAATQTTVATPSPPPLVPTPLAQRPRRFAGSAWLIARGGADGALLGGQLGASQAGVRLTYTLDPGRRLALAARLATPLHGRGREAAIGLDWQPTAAPVHLVAEERVFLDGGKGGPTLSVIGGFGPQPLARGLVVEAYGQAGAIARGGIDGRVDGFADGLARLSHPVARLGSARFDIGVGAWGGAQRGASRLDIGPSIAVGLPVAGKSIRLAADWRERIAGRARPGSGPALSVGSDF